jgi:hypothetical protein
MHYRYLQNRGALNEADLGEPPAPTQSQMSLQAPLARVRKPDLNAIPPATLELVPEALARELVVLPIAQEGETLTLAAANPDDVATRDKLTFVVNRRIVLVGYPRDEVIAAINKHYGRRKPQAVDSMLAEGEDFDLEEDAVTRTASHQPAGAPRRGAMAQSFGGQALPPARPEPARDRRRGGLDTTYQGARGGMFTYTVPEGQRVLMRNRDGTARVIVGPKRTWRWGRTFEVMRHYVAHPEQFLIVRYRDGRQVHLPGPCEVWFDPREHLEVSREEALQLAAKEAVVVYSKPADGSAITRRIVLGPALFIPQPGEWLHTFSWHASRGGSRGVEKVPNGLVFQKLWLMPDQMYHDVHDVRTTDDAVLTIRLMIFFELVDIARMLDSTHDPIGDFVNAATSDVVAFTARHDFEAFKRNTARLNELDAYPQLAARAAQCGYRLNKVVYRGYGTAQTLQQMHDQAIEARTKLQLDRATEQQAQELENYKLDAQLARAAKRRSEQTVEVTHDLELARQRSEADLRQKEAQDVFARQKRQREAELNQEIQRQREALQREHLAALKALGVDLTAFLTQHRADRVIELRGAAGTHVHIDKVEGQTAQG